MQWHLRRIPLALLILLVGSTAATAVAGFDEAIDAKPVPTTFHLAQARHGDLAMYDLAVRDQRGEIQSSREDALGVVHLLTPIIHEGSVQLAREIGIFDWHCAMRTGFTQGFESTLWIQDALVGNGNGCDSSSEPVVEDHAVFGRHATWGTERRLDFEDPRPSLLGKPCLVAPGLEDGVTDGEDPFMPCAIHTVLDHPHAFHFLGMTEHGGQSWMVMEFEYRSGDSVSSHRWAFREDIPFPVQVTQTRHDGASWTYTMDRFSQGGKAPDLMQPGVPLVRPWGMYGPANDVDHPFSLKDAVDVALADVRHQGLQDFMEAHPDAVVQAAHVQVGTDGNDRSEDYTWHFTLADGSRGYGVGVYAERERVLGALNPNLVPEAGPYGPFQTNTFSTEDDVPGVAPADLPKVVPVSWLYAAHEALTGEKPTGWAIENGCVPCERPIQVAASHWGDETSYYWDETDIWWSDDFAQVERFSQMWFTPEGTPTSTWDRTTASAYGEDPAPVPPRHEPVGADAEPVSFASMTVWSLPAGIAAGSAAAALLAAVLYWSWPLLKGLPLFTRIRPETALQHPTRQQILDAITAHPGIHLADLRRQVDKGAGTVRHHVARLADAEHIVVRKQNGYLCHFPAGAPRKVIDGAGKTRSRGAQAVLAAVADGPLTATQIQQQTELSPGTVHYHLGKLKTAGRVQRIGQAYALT